MLLLLLFALKGADGIIIPPAPGGHGSSGPGGHYTGSCLCSPTGCKNISENCLPNPFFHFEYLNSKEDIAIVSAEHIVGYFVGKNDFNINDLVFVKAADAYDNNNNNNNNRPILWRDGRLGGQARIVQWMRCGGRNKWLLLLLLF